MKLICQNCQATIAKENINLQEGIANCTQCHEFFRIADYLTSNEELRRLPKPYYSKVDVIKKRGETSFVIPSSGWTETNVFFLTIVLMLNVVTWSAFFSQTTPNVIVLPLFFGAVISLVLFLFMLYGNTTITVNSSQLMVKRSLAGLGYTRTRNTKMLDRITEDVVYSKNYQPVYGVGLYFKDKGKIKFGSNLKEEERKWIIGELYELKTEMKVN